MERVHATESPKRAPPLRAPEPAVVGGPDVILALQRSAGNAAVARYVNTGVPATGTPPPPGFAAAARANQWLDGAPMRALNSLLNLLFAEGSYTVDTFDALVFLDPAGGGVVDDAMLALLLTRAVERGQQTQFARIVEQQLFGGSRLALSLRFDPGLKTPSEVVHEGALNSVTLGPAAFADLATLQATISAALPAIRGPDAKAAPAALAPDALKEAVAHNSLVLTELVSGPIVALATGGHSDAPATEEFAQWLADFQQRRQLPVNGQLDDATITPIVERLRELGQFESILRLIADYGAIDLNLVADIRYDAHIAEPFRIDRNARGTSAGSAPRDAVTVDFGPNTFLGGFAGIFHTMANAYAQVLARHDGRSELRQRLLGKAAELKRTPGHDAQESVAALRADVRDFLAIWRAARPHSNQDLKLLEEVAASTEERFKAVGDTKAPELRRLRFVLKANQP
ncbi:hypothetical protein [Solirubrobacter soli]|uniref:hypothetical protein n=1 Tax=Solirubrobacter soli TaxID=363832 RepID=UPI0003F8016A|nr:hypothetical protein [Solirubrobacter soli]